MKRILLLASENGAFKGAKVGGIADVIRDLPQPLYDLGVHADIVMPSYGFLIAQNKAKKLTEFWVDFRSTSVSIGVYQLANPSSPNTTCFLLDNPLWHSSPGKIYRDSGHRPFADDANTFALFSAAVAEGLLKGIFKQPDCIHIHDWHASFFLLYVRLMKRYAPIASTRVVLTIHNLALQGIRPLQHDDSSLEAWYPKFFAQLPDDALGKIIDPRYSDCINPLRAGINLADRIHVVSPTYALEILNPSDHSNGFFGGEGLEEDLRNNKRKLCGIINGCNYPEQSQPKNQAFNSFIREALDTLVIWQGSKHALSGQDFIANHRLQRMQEADFEPDFILSSVGRLTDQKMLILRQPHGSHPTVLDAILEKLTNYSPNALLIMVGSGNATITAEFRQVAARWSHFIFLNGYAEALPDWLYKNGDLFLMPSSFEPCGISQMLAMREGQPCLVHGVGGLKDTVEHGKSGFVFGGNNLSVQADNLLSTLDDALATFQTPQYAKIKRSAKARRFSWPRVAKEMIKRLYKLS